MNHLVSQNLARILITTYFEFQKDPNLDSWRGIGRKELLWTITQLTGKEDLGQAIQLLSEIASGEFTSTVPPKLRELVEYYEKWRQLVETHAPAEVLQAQSAAVKAWIERLQAAPKPEVPPAPTEVAPLPKIPPARPSPAPAPKRELPEVEVAERPKPEQPEIYLHLLGRPVTFPQRILNQFSLLVPFLPKKDFSQENLQLLEKALVGLQQEGIYPPGSPEIALLKSRLAQITARQEPFVEARFLLPEKISKLESGKLFKLAFDAQKGSVGFFEEKIPLIKKAAPPVTGAAKNFASRAAITLRRFFTNPNLSWLRISFGGALGFGSLLLPLPLPARIALGGTGGLIAFSDILRSGANIGLFLGRAALRAGAFIGGLTIAPEAIAAVVIALIILLAVGVPMVLTAYTNLTYQSSFLEEAAAEIPSICLPPTDEFPEPFPPPPGLSFSWPVDGQPVCTSPYGYRILEGSCNQHEGIDIGAATGTPIESIATGIVFAVNHSSSGVYGKHVVVKHDGMYSLYAHLDSVNVRVKESVTSETVLGWAGSTGQSTGSHLHLSVSSCGSVLGDSGSVLGDNCFVTNSPNPCLYLTCPGGSTGPSGCVQFDKSVCGEAPICR